MPTDRRVLRELQRKVAIARRVHAVRGRRSESQLARGNRPVERQRCSGHSSRSQRTEVQPRRAILQPARIAQHHLHVSQQPVRHQHRLRALQMRIARHHRVAGLARLLHQRPCPRCQPVDSSSIARAHKAAGPWRSARCGCGLYAASVPASRRAPPASVPQNGECLRPLRDRAPAPCPPPRRAPPQSNPAPRATPLFHFWSGPQQQVAQTRALC